MGGVGMSALAQASLDRGHTVTGSDRTLDNGDLTPILAALKNQGAALFPQDGSGITPETSRVVYSTAIEDDNPDLAAARALGIPVIHRSQALASYAEGLRLIAVTGTCGKSSVTAMLGTLLTAAGFDPFVLNGAEMAGFDNGATRVGAVRKPAGNAAWMVAEADESDRSLLNLAPEHAIITNASADHFPLAETLALFDDFRRRVPGIVVDGIAGLELPEAVEADAWGSHFTYRAQRYALPVPGLHNIQNACHAIEMALRLGADPEALPRGLASYKGVCRRLEPIGTCRGARVIDDYAHNPEKLAAAWRTLAALAPEGVTAVWRPHGFAPLRKMFEALVETIPAFLRPCDRLLILPVFYAGGTAAKDVSSEMLVERLQAAGAPVSFTPSIDTAREALIDDAAPGHILATFGARDPDLPRLARALNALQ